MSGVDAQTVGNVLAVVTAVPATLSVLVYARVPWWRSATGRHLMAFMVALACTFNLAALRILWEPSWFQAVRVGVFVLVPVVLWWRLWMLVREQVVTWRDKRAAAAGEGAVGVPRQGGQDRDRNAAGSGNGA